MSEPVFEQRMREIAREEIARQAERGNALYDKNNQLSRDLEAAHNQLDNLHKCYNEQERDLEAAHKENDECVRRWREMMANRDTLRAQLDAANKALDEICAVFRAHPDYPWKCLDKTTEILKRTGRLIAAIEKEQG